MKKILLTTVCGPFGVDTDDCTEHIQTELFHAQVTRAQGIFSPRVKYISYGLEYIAENLQAPVTVLQYPTMRQFRRELKKGYDYVGINFVIATFEKMRAMHDVVREVSPASEIVLGGYGTMLPACKPYGDHICKEEGVAFLRRLLGESPDGELRHVVYPTFGKIAGVPAMKGAVVMAGLGCPHGCEFCATSHFHKQKHIPLLKTGRDLHREIRRVHSTLENPRLPVGIIEEDFLIQKKRAEEYLECVLEDKQDPIKISCFASAKAISMWDPDDLVRMGIEAIWIGVESQQANYSKLRGVDVKEIINSLHERGINTLASLILGHDFHTEEMVWEDFEYFVSLKPSLSQFLIMTPACSTPFFDRLQANDRLLDVPHREWDGFHLTFKHPNISKPIMEKLILDVYDEEFRRLGPSVLRYVERQLDGYLRYKDSADELLRIRAEQYREECVTALPLFPTAIRTAPSPEVALWLSTVQQRIKNHAGSGGFKNALLKAIVPICARIEQFKLNHLGYSQPKRLRTEYRTGEQKKEAATATNDFSIISRPQPVEGHTLVVDLLGAFDGLSVAAARQKIESYLAEHRGYLAITFTGLTCDEPGTLLTLLEKLKEYRERIKLIDIDSLQAEVTAYAHSCFEVIADLQGLHEKTAAAN